MAKLAALILAVLLLTSSPALATNPPYAPNPEDFIHVDSHALLTLHGSSYCATSQARCEFVGLGVNYGTSVAGAAAKCFGNPANLDAEFKQMGARVAVTRMPFFQYIDTTSGQRDWRPTDATLAVLQANDVRVIAELGDQWGNCEQSGTSVYKNLAWYQGGYKTTVLPGTTQTYRDWVISIATRYRNNPYIAFWQLLNEAEAATVANTTCDETPAAAAMRAFVDDVGGAVHAADPNHLVNLGTIGTGQCGTQAQNYVMVHSSPGIDLCEYHEYEAPNIPVPTTLTTRISQCNGIGKPLFLGEVGIRGSDVGGDLNLRSTDFVAKRNAALGQGAQGFVIYTWCGAPGCDVYGVSPGDPVLGAL